MIEFTTQTMHLHPEFLELCFQIKNIRVRISICLFPRTPQEKILCVLLTGRKIFTQPNDIYWLRFYHLFKISEFSFASSRIETVQVNLLNLGGKARSRYELYKMLIVEGHLYLPPYKYWSVDFMADIIEGKKKVCQSFILLCLIWYRLLSTRIW